MKELTSDNLETVLKENEKVVVQYGATWCGNCRLIKPKFKRLGEETDGIEFYYVDAEKFPNSRQFAEINNLPTFATFHNGEKVGQGMGNKIEKVKELVDALASH